MKRKSGWFFESRRHSLASKGVKSAQKIPNINKCPRMGFKQAQKEIVQMFKQMMKDEDAKGDKMMGKDFVRKYGKSHSFDDVMVLTTKEMQYESNNDASRGWTGTMSGIAPKKKNSNQVMLVTYDGAGYDFFSVNEGASLTNKFQDMLDKKFGKDKFHIEHSTNWAFEVYDER